LSIAGAIVASAGIWRGFTLPAASPIGEGDRPESRSNPPVDCIRQGAPADEASKLVAPGLKPEASFADRGIRKKRLTPKKTAMTQPAINPTDIR
jgi:hypothetical protein